MIIPSAKTPWKKPAPINPIVIKVIDIKSLVLYQFITPIIATNKKKPAPASLKGNTE